MKQSEEMVAKSSARPARTVVVRDSELAFVMSYVRILVTVAMMRVMNVAFVSPFRRLSRAQRDPPPQQHPFPLEQHRRLPLVQQLSSLKLARMNSMPLPSVAWTTLVSNAGVWKSWMD